MSWRYRPGDWVTLCKALCGIGAGTYLNPVLTFIQAGVNIYFKDTVPVKGRVGLANRVKASRGWCKPGLEAFPKRTLEAMVEARVEAGSLPAGCVGLSGCPRYRACCFAFLAAPEEDLNGVKKGGTARKASRPFGREALFFLRRVLMAFFSVLKQG